jgi:outer membrane protein assembly factor BamB
MVGIVSTSDRELVLLGLHPATGEKLWRRPVTPSAVTPGVAIGVNKVGEDKVAYFRPTRDDRHYAELVVADARTGNDLVKSPEAWFTAAPAVCADGKDVCTTSRAAQVGKGSQYRLEIATGQYRADSTGVPSGARPLTKTGLLDLGDRPGNTLGLLRDGTLQWRTPLSSAFPPGFSSDHGWAWHLFTDQHVFVGSVYAESAGAGTKYVRDLARDSATAGLSERTGEVLWRDRGSSFHCELGNGDYPVRCRARGIATFQLGVSTSFDGLDVTVEGFNPVTGQTTWSVPMGAAERLESREELPSIAGPTQVVLDGSKGPIVLDYATGDIRTPAQGATFWCMTAMHYEIAQPVRLPDGTLWYRRPGGALAAICDDRGRPATALPSVAATITAGAYIGSHAVVATRDGYIGFKVR